MANSLELFIFSNSQEFELSSSCLATDTTLNIVSRDPLYYNMDWEQPYFAPNGQGYYTVIATIDDGTNIEIVKITAATSTTLTVERSYSYEKASNTAYAFAAGTKIQTRLTSKALNTFLQNQYFYTDIYSTITGLDSFCETPHGNNVTAVDGDVQGQNGVALRATMKTNGVSIMGTQAAEGQITIGSQTSNGQNMIAIGRATTSTADNLDCISIGHNQVLSYSTNNITIGDTVTAATENSVLIGCNTIEDGDAWGSSVLIGESVSATGGYGDQAIVGAYSTANAGYGNSGIGYYNNFLGDNGAACGSATHTGSYGLTLGSDNNTALSTVAAPITAIGTPAYIPHSTSMRSHQIAQIKDRSYSTIASQSGALHSVHSAPLMLGDDLDAADTITNGTAYKLGDVRKLSGYNWYLIPWQRLTSAGPYTFNSAYTPSTPATTERFQNDGTHTYWWKLDAEAQTTASVTIAPDNGFLIPQKIGIVIDNVRTGTGSTEVQGSWALKDSNSATVASGTMPPLTAVGVHIFDITLSGSNCQYFDSFTFEVTKSQETRAMGRAFIIGAPIVPFKSVFV